MGELRLTVQTGLLMRGTIRTAIEEYCFQRGFGCSIQQERFWFHYRMHVTVSAPDRYIPQVEKDMEFLLA